MAISYIGELGDGQRIVVESEGAQTSVTQASGGAGQQQSQRNGFETGAWTMPPTLFRTSTGLVLRIEGAQGQSFVGFQGQQIRMLHTPPSLVGAEVLPLRQAASTGGTTPLEPMHALKPMQPMRPMEPLEPLKPMQMRMGAMQMQMGTMETNAADHSQPVKRFCGQCGHAAADSDHFCTRCGHRLA